MVTLLIGMLLAFILGAMTAILPLWISNPDLFKRTYSASVLSASDQLQTYPAGSIPSVWKDVDPTMKSVTTATKPAEEKPKEKTAEEKKREAYLEQIANMLDYDGSAQEGSKVK